MDTQNVVCPINEVLFSYKKEESTIHATKDKPGKYYAKLKMANTKGHYGVHMPLCKSYNIYGIYIKYPQYANPYRQKVDEWLSETGGKGAIEVTGNEYVVFCGGGDENILELDSGSGFKIL